MLLRLVLSTLTTLAAGLSCKSDTGSTVDWWVAIKEPRGSAYLYADSDDPSEFAVSKHSMNDTTVGAVPLTTAQLWTSSPFYVMWNDEPALNPAPPYSYTVGHTKGFMALDTVTDTGIFVTHSIPIWPAGPNQTAKYRGLGSNAWTYGQNVACFSVDGATLDAIAARGLMWHGDVYDTDGSTTHGNLTAFAKGTYTNPATCTSTPVTTVGGQPLTVFGKTPAWDADLWSACVAPTLKKSLLVESWLRGSEEGPACSGAYTTVDVNNVSFSSSATWTETNDHSKWAVATDGSWLCMGDINRMTTQFARAGGATCWQTPLGSVFKAASETDGGCNLIT